MLTEIVELTMRHLGLGDLDEFGLLTLFADLQAKRLLEGTGHTLREVVDAGGAPLYPAYYRTHVRVPTDRLLSTFRLWSRISAGVEVNSFGGMLLESRYVVTPEGDVPEDVAAWDDAGFPTMHASSMFIVDDLSPSPQAGGPGEGAITELDRLERAPEGMMTFRKLRAGGSLVPRDEDTPDGEPVRYRIEPRRDAASGHNMMFAQYVRIMDHAEAETLTRALGADLPGELETLERETYYFGNSQAGETVLTRLRGSLSPCPDELGPPPEGVVFVGILEWDAELSREGGDGDRLAVARCRKVLTVPAGRSDLLDRASELMSSPRAGSIGRNQ